MTTADKLIDEIQQLPEPLQQEVFDFTQFLKERLARAEANNLMQAQQRSMEGVWDNTEDEVWNNVPTR
ncbi:DUF2281 domain-containing protein [Sulfurivermis fontis]|uniref:DUF2281 domain-containing protein n=1 Tax=Sulfurivermis fontis TaxID=1972068 RepID=UPI000FD9CCCE|nr:DUF2281 domain-containing protein [Sulfurivermis fontis]